MEGAEPSGTCEETCQNVLEKFSSNLTGSEVHRTTPPIRDMSPQHMMQLKPLARVTRSMTRRRGGSTETEVGFWTQETQVSPKPGHQKIPKVKPQDSDCPTRISGRNVPQEEPIQRGRSVTLLLKKEMRCGESASCQSRPRLHPENTKRSSSKEVKHRAAKPQPTITKSRVANICYTQAPSAYSWLATLSPLDISLTSDFAS